MARVTFEGTSRTYPGTSAPAVDGLDLEIDDGEFVVLVGPSGCGKSTTLRMLAGLEPCDQGSIRVDDDEITHLHPKDRDVAMVFQNYALYPHMSVAQNIGYHLKLKRTPKEEVAERVRDAAKLLGIEDFLDRKPAHLSGGQRQRVAMGRAIVRRPKVFLMDEPLSNLDAKLRVQTRAEIASLQRRLGVTTVYVTHDQVEAMTMGDRVALMHEGVLQQCASPREMYSRPNNVFVAGFIGSPAMNLLTVPVEGDTVRLGDLEVPLGPKQLEALTGDHVTVGARPEEVSFVGESEGALRGEVEVVEELGSDAYAYCKLEGFDATSLIVRCEGRHPPSRGDRVNLRIAPEWLHLFDSDSGERLPE